MSKSKMAVRNKEKNNQLKFDFGIIDKTKNLLNVLLISLFIAGFGFLLIKGNDLWNELLPVNRIILLGETKYLTQQDLTDFMQQQSNFGLLALDLAVLQSNAKKIDWIKSVEIRKVWPETLVFSVEEHQPVAVFGSILLTQQGTLVGIKNEKTFEDELISELPKISLMDSREKPLDEYRFIWREFKQMKRDFEIVSLDLNHLYIDDVNNWRLDFIDDFSINLGRKDRLARVERLVKVFKMIENRKAIKNIDLRYHNGFAIEWLDKTSLNQQELKQPELKQIG